MNSPKINPEKAWAKCKNLKDVKTEDIEMTTDWSGWNIKTENIKIKC